MSNQTRDLIIDLIHNKKLKIVEASQITGIPYENAKAIYRIFRLEGRSKKKTYKIRSKPRNELDFI